jgi:hypothetical protein
MRVNLAGKCQLTSNMSSVVMSYKVHTYSGSSVMSVKGIAKENFLTES